MAYQTPDLFTLSPSTKRRIDTPHRRATRRPSAADTPLQVAAAQAKRSELEALPSAERVMYATTTGANWTLVDEAGVTLKQGSAGRDFGTHHTLSIAVGKAIELAALDATESSACHLVVRVADRTFNYVNRVGTAEDGGKGGKVRGLALRAFKVRVLLVVEHVDSMPDVAQAAPAAEARVPLPAPVVAFGPEHYIDKLAQALHACAARLSPSEVAHYTITSWIGQGEREFIHSLAGELAGAGAGAAASRTETLPMETGRTPEDYLVELIGALHAFTAHLSADAAARRQIIGRAGRAERELIRSLSREPAMADVQDGLYDRPNGVTPTMAPMVPGEAGSSSWQRTIDDRVRRGELPF